jgi:prepilin-type N-terminal cleavage/methylation domain-containing protein
MTMILNMQILPRRRPAFTLVEMLIVLGIIALLVAVLLPALSRARSQAKHVLCQSRLQQWGVAFELYTSDNSGFYPHIDGLDRQDGSTPRRSADIADYYGWVDMLPRYLNEKPWRNFAPFRYPGPKTIFQCPAAVLAPAAEYGYNPRRNGYFSYAMNSCLELDENCWHNPTDTIGPMPSFLKTQLIRTPSRLGILFDQLLDPRFGYDGNRRERSAGQHCGSYPKAFSSRHRRGSVLGGSILFGDYHVEWRKSIWKPTWPPDLEVPPPDDLDWYPY